MATIDIKIYLAKKEKLKAKILYDGGWKGKIGRLCVLNLSLLYISNVINSIMDWTINLYEGISKFEQNLINLATQFIIART